MARRHRHTQQGKEPRCPRPPPPLLHRGRSQSPDRSPRPQGRGVSRREGRGRAVLAPPTRRRAHTWPAWGWGKIEPGLRGRVPLSRLTPPRLASPRPAPPQIASHKLSKGCVLGSFTTKSVLLEGRMENSRLVSSNKDIPGQGNLRMADWPDPWVSIPYPHAT